MSQDVERLVDAWKQQQQRIAANVIDFDDVQWSHRQADGCPQLTTPMFVAGADVSFSTTDEGAAVATITVIRKSTQKMDLVFSKSRKVSVDTPYVPSFLSFREAPLIASLFSDIPQEVKSRIDCLLVDGNGILHPRRAGLACHLGVELNIPTIGVSKSLYCHDGLDEHAIRSLFEQSGTKSHPLKGDSGTVWGRALLTGNAINKPIYVSVGHKVSLESAALLVQELCLFRVPEPIRLADQHSREALRVNSFVDIYQSAYFNEHM